MEWYLNAFKNYTDFYGRSSRTEYWMFIAFNIVFAVLAYSFDLIFDFKLGDYELRPIYILYALITFIPGLALSIRRLHDVDKSGWYLLLLLIPLVGSIWLLILYATKGVEEENAYGINPKNEEPIASFITSDATNNKIIITAVLWMLINTLLWVLIIKFVPDYYKSKLFIIYREIVNLIWMLLPFFLTLSVKNVKWKIILLALSIIYLLYQFIEFIEMHEKAINQFQF